GALSYSLAPGGNSNPGLLGASVNGTTKTLTLSPLANQVGTATITVRVMDPLRSLFVDLPLQVTVHGPDLVASNLTVAPPSAQWNGPVTVGLTVTNQEIMASQNFDVEVRISNTPSVSSTSDLVSVFHLAGLGPNQSVTVPPSLLTLPSDQFQPGTYYIG